MASSVQAQLIYNQRQLQQKRNKQQQQVDITTQGSQGKLLQYVVEKSTIEGLESEEEQELEERHLRHLLWQIQDESLSSGNHQRQLGAELELHPPRNSLHLFSMTFNQRPQNAECFIRSVGMIVTIFQLLLLLTVCNQAVLAEGNVGCHFVRTLCLKGSEVCFDDNIFGKCIPTTGVDVKEIEKTPLTDEQSQALANMLEELQGEGLGWDHPYVQCRVQGSLYSLQKQTPLPPNLCANLAPIPPPMFQPASALAFVRLTPPLQKEEEQQEQLDYKYFYPPLKKLWTNGIGSIYQQLQQQERQSRHDPLELEHFERDEAAQDPTSNAQSVIEIVLDSERNRIQREQEQREAELEAERKNALNNRFELYQMLAASEPDPQPYQRNPPAPPVLTPLSLSAFDKLERIVEKDAPYQHHKLDENEQYFPEHYMQFKRLGLKPKNAESTFFRELAAEKGLEQEPLDPLIVDDNWMTSTNKHLTRKNYRALSSEDTNDFTNEHDIFSRLRDNSLTRNSLTPFQQEAMLASNSFSSNSKHNERNPERIFTEAGLVYVPEENDAAAEELTAELKKEKARELLENMLGFTRRERLDVKKPGPLVGPPDANSFKQENKTQSKSNADTKEVVPAHIKTNHKTHNKKNIKSQTHSEEDHAPHTVDTEYAHVYVKNPIDSWNDGVRIMNELANILHMQGYFTYLTVQQHLVSFRVDSNNPEHKTALDIARFINENRGVKNNILRRLGVTIVQAGVGDRVRVDEVDEVSSSRITSAEPVPHPTHVLAYMFAGAGIAAVVLIFITLILIKRHDKKRDKLEGLHTSTAGAETCSKDYQELCRARMSGKGSATDPPTCGRITSLSKENDRPSSSRSSTSSWCEEPALTNMDISTGHMVLSYMEDHLRNKGRLQREWEALCRYEAEPSARDAAQQPQCINFNRPNAPLPYDHSRVVLNHLANAEGLDYINASTITDHDPRAPAYVAAQGPLPTTLAHFWQMIWEQGAVVIVALCRLQENGEISCARYWPEEGAEVYHIYEVHLVSEHIWCDDYLVRSFYLKNLRTSETRTVTQFHFLSWPQGSVPAQAKALLDFRRKVNKSYRGRSCPIVVHGSTGAGRTGAYILLDLVLGRMNKGAREIDIAATLEHLRDQRAGLVETRQQFEFVLMAVAEEVHAILKALPANQSNEKRELDGKESSSPTSTTTTNNVLLEEEPDEEPSTSKKDKDTAKPKDKGKPTSTNDKDTKLLITPVKTKKK